MQKQKINFDDAKNVLNKFSNVCDAWVFGSAQNGFVAENSDIDIAIRFNKKPDFDLLTSVMGSLQTALDFENIDIAILNNDVSSILRFEAVSGVPLVCKDKFERAGFVSLAAREYEDDMEMIKHCLKM